MPVVSQRPDCTRGSGVIHTIGASVGGGGRVESGVEPLGEVGGVMQGAEESCLFPPPRGGS